MSEPFLEPPRPTNKGWALGYINNLFQLYVNHDHLATRNNVKIEILWDDQNFDTVGGVKVWMNPGTPDSVLLAEAMRKDSVLGSALVREFQKVRKLLLLL